MRILGLSALAHDPAAALVDESGVVAAIEEAKLTRRREAAGIPRAAIAYCLTRSGGDWNDLAQVAVASRPLDAWRRGAWLRLRSLPAAPVAGAYYQAKLFGELSRELNNLRILRQLAGPPEGRVVALDHHLCHAASAFYASPFDHAAILSLDEAGDGVCGLLATGEGTRIRPLRTIRFPDSPAWVFTQVTELLGFAPRREEHKTQWLSLAGDPALRDLFLALLRREPGPFPQLDRSYFTRGLAGRLALGEKFYRAAGLAPGHRPGEDLRRRLAAGVQQACTEVALELTRWLREETGARSLCLSGGLFLNSLLVAELEARAGYEQVFVQPAAGNEGTALGAAWLVRHHLRGLPRAEPPVSVAWGPSFSGEEIKQVLDNCKARYRLLHTEAERTAETIRLLEAGKIVAWFQGPAEFGPRALGQRSLLALPFAPYVKDNLNDYVKHREAFHPFAVAVREEDAARYFDAGLPARFMASLGAVRPEARSLLEGFLLPGGRVRLHVVTERANPLLWRLLAALEKQAAAPLLVNTSFNLFGEPLVVTPRDAVRSFFCSGIDALLIGSFLLTKD